MGLTFGEKEDIKLYAKEAAREIVKEALVEHIKGCPIGWNMKKYVIILVSICFGSTILGSLTLDGLIKIIASISKLGGFNG